MRRYGYWCALLFVLLFTSVTYAGSGKAYIPHYFVMNTDGTTTTPTVLLSNITGSSLTVEVTFYKENNSGGSAVVFSDGDDNISTGTIRAVNVSNYDEGPSSGSSVKFDIAPYETIEVYLSLTTGQNFGYGIIEWNQDSNAITGLIGYMALTIFNSSASYRSDRTVTINNGTPF